MIEQHNNILPQEIFDQCCEYSLSLIKNRSRIFFTNYAWPEAVVDDSAPLFVHPLTPKEILFVTVQQHIFSLFSLNTKQVHFTYWPVYSYIPWHKDGNKALTIYLS